MMRDEDTRVASDCRGSRTTGWAMSFDSLLADSAGVYAFSNFCKRELSDENIRFYQACVKFSALCDEQELKSESEAIFEQHLSKIAPDPVNVDSKARQAAARALINPRATMFAEAQQQVYNLMKYDCFKRFLESEEFSNCVVLEIQDKPLPDEESSSRRRTSSFFSWYKPRNFRPRISMSTTKKVTKKLISKIDYDSVSLQPILSPIATTPNEKQKQSTKTCSSGLKYISHSELDLSFRLRENEANSEDFFNDIIRGAQCAPSVAFNQSPMFSYLSQPCLYTASKGADSNMMIEDDELICPPKPLALSLQLKRSKSPAPSVLPVLRRSSLARFSVSPTKQSSRCKSMVVSLEDEYQALWDSSITTRRQLSSEALKAPSKIPVRRAAPPPPVPPKPKFKVPLPPPPRRRQPPRVSKIPVPEAVTKNKSPMSIYI